MGATPIDDNDADGKSGKLYGWLLIIRCTSYIVLKTAISFAIKVYLFTKSVFASV